MYGLLDQGPEEVGVLPRPPEGRKADHTKRRAGDGDGAEGPPPEAGLMEDRGVVRDIEKGMASPWRWFDDECSLLLRHNRAGTLAMANKAPNANGSPFYMTLADDSPSLRDLDGKHTVFGRVVEDLGGVVAGLNAAVVDPNFRPLRHIRIRDTVVLVDPFPDPPGLEALVGYGAQRVSPWRFRPVESALLGE